MIDINFNAEHIGRLIKLKTVSRDEESRCQANERPSAKPAKKEMINYGSVAVEMPSSSSVKQNDVGLENKITGQLIQEWERYIFKCVCYIHMALFLPKKNEKCFKRSVKLQIKATDDFIFCVPKYSA